MKIWGDVPKVSGIYGNAGKIEKATKKDAVASRKDELTISGAAKDFSMVMKALKNIPDIRQEKVSEISTKMESGNYSVSPRDVSAKIADMINKKG